MTEDDFKNVSAEEDTHWYAIHTKPKSEHIATAHLKHLDAEMEVFCPRIRFQKKTRRGKIWFVEAMFPGYTFARIDLGQWLRAVNATAAVLGVVRFGPHYPPVPDEIVDEWRANVNAEAVITVEEKLAEGDEVEVVEGPAIGIRAVITKVLPGHERVNILMDMLGQTREVEVSRDAVSRKRDIRLDSDEAAAG